MNRLFHLLFVFAITLGNCFASPVSHETAAHAAVNWMSRINHAPSSVVISNSFDLKVDGTITAYVFNMAGGGYVIVSADDLAIPILMFSEDGRYNPQQINPAFTELMDMVGEEILTARGECDIAPAMVTARWQQLTGFNLRVTSPEIFDLDIQVYDSLGRFLRSYSASAGSGSSTLFVNTVDLKVGNYLLRITDGHNSACRFFTVLR
jgi:hypothetical protein